MTIDNTVFSKIWQGTKNTLIVIFMVLFVIFLGNGLNLMGWSYLVQIRYYVLLAFACYALYFLYTIKYRNRHIPFKYYVLFLTVWPVSCHLSSLILGGTLSEDIIQSVPWLFVSTMFLIFYRFSFTEKKLLLILGIVAIITVIIQIVQQVEPSLALFGDTTGENLADTLVSEERNGIIRLFVGCYLLQVLMLLFFWCKFMQTFRIHWAILTGLLVYSVYIYLTKQILISVMATLAISLFMLQGRRIKAIALLIMVVLCTVLLFFWDDLFGELIQDSKDDSFSHAIRFEFIGYILQYFVTHPVQSIFGHGYSIPLIQEWIHKLYHLSDIGLFGEAFTLGWPWSLAYLCVAFRVFVTYRNKVPLYIRLYILCTGIISIFIFPYRNRIEMFTWISVIYICSLHISQEDNNDEEENNDNNDEILNNDTNIQKQVS